MELIIQVNAEAEKKIWFRNPKEVHEHLHGAGIKVSQATVYNHRKEGKLVPDQEGGFSLNAVDRYVKTWLESDHQPSIDELEKQQKDKKNAETLKLEAQAEHWQIKTNILRGQYIDRAQYEQDLAARAMLLKADGDNFFRAMAPEMVAIVDGDVELTSDLTDYLVRNWEIFLGRYSEKREFAVPNEQTESMN